MEFRQIERLELEGKRAVYQGLPGAYGHAAALRFFGGDADISHVRTFEDLLRALSAGDADYAVMPIENSTAGTVTDNFDLLLRYPHSIVAETFVPVNHCLLAVPGTKREEIRSVCAHPQSLMQCAEYLRDTGWTQTAMENNAVAAKSVEAAGDRSRAAIASAIAGQLYHLDILDEGINDRKDNTTRFLILCRDAVYRKNAGKISLCFSVEHTTGSLYNALGHLIYNNINMTMIQSRPIPDRSWDYRFFVDVEGNLSEPSVGEALRGLGRDAKELRILGCY